jgi:hypothetical protein
MPSGPGCAISAAGDDTLPLTASAVVDTVRIDAEREPVTAANASDAVAAAITHRTTAAPRKASRVIFAPPRRERTDDRMISPRFDKRGPGSRNEVVRTAPTTVSQGGGLENAVSNVTRCGG